MIALVVHSILILSVAYSFRPTGRDQMLYWLALSLKLAMGTLLGFIYFHFIQGGDTVFFHNQAKEMFEMAQNNLSDYLTRLFAREYHIYKGEARNELFIKITSVFYLVSWGNYWVASLYYSLISFFGSWYFVSSIKKHFPDLKIPAAIAFLFWPSVVFWSSGVLKDSIISASLFFVGGIAVHYLKKHSFRWAEILLFTISCLLLFYLKHYLFAVMLVILSIIVWYKQILPLIQSGPVKVMLSTVALIGCILLASVVNPRLNLGELPQTIVTNYQVMQERSESQTADFQNLQPTWASIFFHAPKSLFTGLFRPFPWEVSTTLLPFSLESCLIFLLILLNIRYIRHTEINFMGWLAIFLTVILATLLPLVSPNFGSLVRYKVAYLPYLSFLLMITPFRLWFTKEG